MYLVTIPALARGRLSRIFCVTPTIPRQGGSSLAPCVCLPDVCFQVASSAQIKQHQTCQLIPPSSTTASSGTDFLHAILLLLVLQTRIICKISQVSTYLDSFNKVFPGFPRARAVKRLPAMGEIWVQSLGREDALEKEIATHSSSLAWKIPWTEEPGRLRSMGSQRVRHN